MTHQDLHKVNQQLVLRLHQQELVATFASFALRTDVLQLVLEEACRVAAAGLRCPLAKVLEFLPNENVLLIQAGIGWHPGTVGHVKIDGDMGSPAGYAFKTSRSVLSNHLGEETRFRTPQVMLEHDVHSALNVPIVTPDRRYGVLEADSPAVGSFESSDTSFLEALASLLAHVILRHEQQVAAHQAKDLLMLEVHHRVKNSLQLVQNLLTLQSRASEDEKATEQLQESAARVHTIGAIHDYLYKTGATATVEVSSYLQGLVDDLRAGMASTLDGRTITVESERVVWPAADMPTLGLVLTELVTNALKYGQGTIRIHFAEPPGTDGILTVEDEGRDLPADFSPNKRRGLGMRLVMGLLHGGEAGLTIDRSRPNTSFVARLPPSRPSGS